MTSPEQRTRRLPAGRRFDLRATAMFFGLAALGLGLVGLVVRMAFDVAERRPAWAVLLSLGVVTALVVGRRGRSGFSTARLARRTTNALEQATATALDELDAERPAAPAPVTAPGGEPPAAEVPTAEVPAMEATAVEVPAVEITDHHALSPDEFEQAIADLCVRDGCAEVEVVGGAGDLGADVLAVTPDGRRLVIQCKRYGEDNKVGSEELQRFGGTCFTVHGADVAVLVTSSDFTAPAADYAEQCGIVCVDQRRLRAWSEGTGPEPWVAEPGAEQGADLPDRASW
ncbi:restriction endonuclease [Streptomyces sp. JHA26]|uniref:restriction endonuclease n=1 Tax=Streptomyces sp. JHA26 TaxID=1917143 RepID=UPI00098AAA3C|nr:restriction endonuclease [Streptomyces sp. JHA26]